MVMQIWENHVQQLNNSFIVTTLFRT